MERARDSCGKSEEATAVQMLHIHRVQREGLYPTLDERILATDSVGSIKSCGLLNSPFSARIRSS
jgi:hypothetical protein